MALRVLRLTHIMCLRGPNIMSELEWIDGLVTLASKCKFLAANTPMASE